MKRLLAFTARAAAIAIAAPVIVSAQTGPGEGNASYTFHYFSDVAGVSVYTHYAGAETRLLGDVDLSVQWGHDIVVFPAIDAPPGSQEAVDAITSASRPIAGNNDPYEDFVKIRDRNHRLALGGRTVGGLLHVDGERLLRTDGLRRVQPRFSSGTTSTCPPA